MLGQTIVGKRCLDTGYEWQAYKTYHTNLPNNENGAKTGRAENLYPSLHPFSSLITTFAIIVNLLPHTFILKRIGANLCKPLFVGNVGESMAPSY